MRARSRLKWLALLLATVFVPASATFHFMKIVELFPGTPAAPAAHYVVLKMYASGQQFVSGHPVTVYDAAGQVIDSYVFGDDLRNGANQATILVATPQAEAFFAVSADLTMSASLMANGGKVCFSDTIDCVAWGAYSGNMAGVGTPFNAGSGLLSGRAAVRRLDRAGSSSTLDAGDDTDNSAADFVFGTPAPRNNAGVLGTVPGATCGNGALEGLEQCDDGNVAGGDGCSSTCTPDQPSSPARPPLAVMGGDYDADGRDDVFWRNRRTGANAIWRSADSTTGLAVPRVSNLEWTVVGIGDFDADAFSDVLWRNGRTGANAIWRSGNPATQQAVSRVSNVDWSVVATGDFNGDGHHDLFWRNRRTGANAVWLSADSAAPQPVARVSSLDWWVVGAGDFDGDMRADVLWRNVRTGANAIWRSANGSTPHAIAAVSNLDWQVVGIGDFGGDGRDDLFWRNQRTGANVVWRSANHSTSQPTTGVSNPAWVVAQTGDYDGDGRSDVLWRNGSTGANAIWRSALSGSQQPIARVSNVDWLVVPDDEDP